MAGQKRLYFCDGDDAFVLRSLDGLTLLYHRPSGITHILDSPLPEIIAALEREPLAPDILMAQLSRHYDLEGDAAELELHLGSLVALGLARVAL